MDFHEKDNDIIRSSCSQMFFKIGVIKHFAIFTGKQSCRPEGLLHRLEKLLHRCFPVDIMNFFQSAIFYRTPPVAAFLLSCCFS